MTYILPNTTGTTDTQGTVLTNKGRVRYNAIYDDVNLTYTQQTANELYEIAEANFETNPWFDVNGDPIDVAQPTQIYEDYEDAHVWFRTFVDGVVNDYIYNTPQIGENFNKVIEYLDMKQYCIELDDGYATDDNGEYILLEDEYNV